MTFIQFLLFYYIFSGIYCGSAINEALRKEKSYGYSYGPVMTTLLVICCVLFGFIIMPWQLGEKSQS